MPFFSHSLIGGEDLIPWFCLWANIWHLHCVADGTLLARSASSVSPPLTIVEHKVRSLADPYLGVVLGAHTLTTGIAWLYGSPVSIAILDYWCITNDKYRLVLFIHRFRTHHRFWTHGVGLTWPSGHDQKCIGVVSGRPSEVLRVTSGLLFF